MPSYEAEEGIDGTYVTTTQSGFTSVLYNSGSYVGYISGAAWTGNLGYQCYTGAAAGYAHAVIGSVNTAPGTPYYRCRKYFRFGSLPPGTGTIIRIAQQGSVISLITVRLNSNGTVSLTTTSGNVVRYTSTMVLAANTWYRVELVAKPGTSSANGIVGLGIVPAGNNISTVNGASNAYYYSSAVDLGASLGIGAQSFGRAEPTSAPNVWDTPLDFDSLSADLNVSFTSNPTTWIGKAAAILTTVLAMRATPAIAVAGSSVRQVDDVFTPRATPALGVTGAPVQKSAVLSARGTPILAVGPTVGRSYELAAAALARMALAAQASRSYVLSVLGSPAMVVNRGPSQVSAALALAAAAALANDGIRGSSSSLSMQASARALYGPQVVVLGNLGMSARPSAEFAVERLWQGLFQASSVVGMALGPLRVALAGLAVRGTPALALAGRLDQPRALVVRGTPLLAVVGREDQSRALSAEAAARVVLGGHLIIGRTLAMAVIARMIHFGATVEEVRAYDDVLAIILSQGSASRIFEAVRLAELLDNGLRRANLLGAPFQAVPLPGGTMAVIQD